MKKLFTYALCAILGAGLVGCDKPVEKKKEDNKGSCKRSRQKNVSQQCEIESSQLEQEEAVVQ